MYPTLIRLLFPVTLFVICLDLCLSTSFDIRWCYVCAWWDIHATVV